MILCILARENKNDREDNEDIRCDVEEDVDEIDKKDGIDKCVGERKGICKIVFISDRGELCGDSPRGRDSDWTTPAIKTPNIINSPIINIITAYTNSIGSRRYSCVLLLSINNTAL